eukprot:1783232-Amphidinium_carterae.1
MVQRIDGRFRGHATHVLKGVDCGHLPSSVVCSHCCHREDDGSWCWSSTGQPAQQSGQMAFLSH